MPTRVTSQRNVGPLLRGWREHRRLSQLDLALDAGISARHVSFVETGRSRPSADMVLQLAKSLEIPLRDRNRMLLAAGHAPVFEQHDLDDPEMTPVRTVIQQVLDAHEPYPAVVVDGAWEMIAANRAVSLLIDGIGTELLEPPANVLRMSLHPEGLAPRIVNLGAWRGHLLDRLARQIALTGSQALKSLRAELESYPAPAPDPGPSPISEIAVPLHLRALGAELAFISTVATFGTAVEVTASELSIESFFPANAATAEAMRAHSAGSSGLPMDGSTLRASS